MSVNDIINKEFEKVYYDNYDYIYKFLITKLDDRHSAEDIIQSVFLKFYRRLSADGEASILNTKHYLLKIAKSMVADHYRSSGKIETQDIGETDIADEKALDMLEHDDSFTYEEIMEWLKKSDDITYRIFIMHFKYDYTIEKTAKALKLPESTVKSKLYRALKKLKNKYKEGAVYESV